MFRGSSPNCLSVIPMNAHQTHENNLILTLYVPAPICYAISMELYTKI